MLGDSVNSFSNIDLDRFYLSTIGGYYPLEHNAFDVTRKRCQTRNLRTVEAANTDEIFDISANDADYSSDSDNDNVVGIFSRKESARNAERAQLFTQRRSLAWQTHYLRGAESA